ncbi:hypothetical protein [Burkholderia cenocepacia]|uniref:hypothetical protein n=1 Tax=Burkholderia cenocepacia TaxID=95486 RepID=UPI00076212B7|nr:hypothetical protein [Burkholderia cenocepacia]KWU26395.1 hypothetical protein AS149_25745 [Burkholderia cenocepacia]
MASYILYFKGKEPASSADIDHIRGLRGVASLEQRDNVVLVNHNDDQEAFVRAIETMPGWVASVRRTYRLSRTPGETGAAV